MNGQVSPVTYTVSLKQGKGHSYEVDIRLMAPRDWLVQRGFERDAVLVSQSGARIPIYHDGAIVMTMAIITATAVSTLPTRSRSN